MAKDDSGVVMDTCNAYGSRISSGMTDDPVHADALLKDASVERQVSCPHCGTSFHLISPRGVYLPDDVWLRCPKLRRYVQLEALICPGPTVYNTAMEPMIRPKPDPQRATLVRALMNPSKEVQQYGALRVARAVGPELARGVRLCQNGLLVLGTYLTVVIAEENAGDDDCYLRAIKYAFVDQLLDDGWELA